ncbi:hypothetical protein F2P56_011035 [Juglans regia]|uniref:Uncharacterized protein n=1 Tax=Juglans regia TaxID=51240 RepID=A0A834CTS7_JUGRE|nr:hypothetical protein F2P56_011035 [Juglans regia]
MIFSRLGRSLTRSSRSRNLLNGGGGGGGGGRSAIPKEGLLQAPRVNEYLGRAYGGSGFFRRYSATIGAHRDFASKLYWLDFKHVPANPRFRRLFSSEAPKKKNYENFYPKEKKKSPKGNEQKSESKGENSCFQLLK